MLLLHGMAVRRRLKTRDEHLIRLARRSDSMSRLFVCSLGRRGTKLTLQMKASTLLRPRELQPSAASAARCARAPSCATCRSMWMALRFGLGDCHSLRWESLLAIGLLVPASAPSWAVLASRWRASQPTITMGPHCAETVCGGMAGETPPSFARNARWMTSEVR